LQHGGHHVLIRATGVGRVRAAKRDPHAADDGNSTSQLTVHTTLRLKVFRAV
jgi:hypothetical protein